MSAGVTYIHKRNRTPLQKRLDWRVKAMMQLCLDDLARCGLDRTIHVVLQCGQSRSQRRYYGLCEYHQTVPTIYVYTYRLRIKGILDTLAHEFGHVRHFVLWPESTFEWDANRREVYATAHARTMLRTFERVYGVIA